MLILWNSSLARYVRSYFLEAEIMLVIPKPVLYRGRPLGGTCVGMNKARWGRESRLARMWFQLMTRPSLTPRGMLQYARYQSVPNPR